MPLPIDIVPKAESAGSKLNADLMDPEQGSITIRAARKP